MIFFLYLTGFTVGLYEYKDTVMTLWDTVKGSAFDLAFSDESDKSI